MYVREDGQEVLKRDVLDLLERHAADSAVVVVSSASFPASNKEGDNPPHVIARARYEEIAQAVVCTSEYADETSPHPVVFATSEDGLAIIAADNVAKSAAMSEGRGLALAGAGMLAALAATAILVRRRRQVSQPRGIEQVRQAVTSARGAEAVGFGSL
jgi:hypothetical protein